MNVYEKWTKSPEYRAQVVRELERNGTIERLSKASFGSLVYDGKSDIQQL